LTFLNSECTLREPIIKLDQKFRPSRFDDVIGQDAIVTVLKATVRKGIYTPASLFCGPPGTGKTTIGRIFAMAVLCENPVDGNPCGVCESCQLFLREQHYGYTEIDAASIGGKDDMVKLRDNASYSSISKKKIIHLDECHDISSAGQDALLKQVEQCPEHLMYLFSTTDPDKVKPTLRDRCRIFQTSRIDTALITNHLQIICEKEGMSYDMDALLQIADKCNGQMRNAIKTLEGVIYLGSVTIDNLNIVVKNSDEDIFTILNNLGVDINQVVSAYSRISSYLSPNEFYSRFLDLINDACRFMYGFDSYLPRKKSMVTQLRDTHGTKLFEFLNYYISRDKFIDRVSLMSDLLVLHYKFAANSFVAKRPVENLQIQQPQPQNSVQQPQPVEQPAESSQPTVTFNDLQKLSIKDRSKLLRDQRRAAEKIQTEEEISKVPVEWPLPKEERPGDNSIYFDKKLSPQEFSQGLVGGRIIGI